MRTLMVGIRALLQHAGLYHRIKASRLYDLYWAIADRRVLDDRRAEVDFYRRHLNGFRAGDLIFDIGANQGYKTDIFRRLGARVVSVEPDRYSQEVLRQRFLQYRFRKPPIAIVGRAVSDRETVETMWLDAPGSAKNTLSLKWAQVLRNDERRFGMRLNFGHRQDIATIRLETLVTLYGDPFFIKVDVEGHELAVLRGLEHPVPYVSFEVNLPEFRSEGEECIYLLSNLAADARFNYVADCRKGLVLKRWLNQLDFLRAFSDCAERSIDIFWTPQNRRS
jgi:FkbM family methyltransferase